MCADRPEVFYAHTQGSSRDWEPLEYHLRDVATRATEIAAPNCEGLADLAYLVGLWHDLGKFNPDFQSYLRASSMSRPHPRVPHAEPGGRFAFHMLKRLQIPWEEIVLPITGHHTGLKNRDTLEQRFSSNKPKDIDVVNLIQNNVVELGLQPRFLRVPMRTGTSREMFIRMLLSIVRDADWLCTENHFNPAAASERTRWPSVDVLLRRYDLNRKTRFERVQQTPVDDVRDEVYQACLRAANGDPGIYRLTVPTGGGKTLSSLAFALNHCKLRAQRRVIVALPYTSIIDQTAKEYRAVLGEDAVLEHHGQVDRMRQESSEPDQMDLATENWDAPIVVTTTVQLFESLLHRSTSRVRRIHNIARSVLILDEVQTLPPELLAPISDVLRTLVDEYEVTLVLSTATQPTFEGLPGIRELGGTEIVADHQRYFEQMRRVRYERLPEPVTWKELAQSLTNHTQAMVILNTRRDALRLIEALPEERTQEVMHLSTLLCGAHRRKVLDDVEDRLDRQRPVLLVSTQVVEAGVDISFPTVFRAEGPLDRIVQAAGRCNRNKELDLGTVVVFHPAQGGEPTGPYKVGIEKARLLLQDNPPESLHNPDLYREYFKRLYSDVDVDKYRIQKSRERLDYPRVAQEFRMIREDTTPVVVPYGDAEERLGEWQRSPSRRTWQRLQPYIVGLHDSERRRLEGVLLRQVSEGLYEWTDKDSYDEKVGLKEVMRDPSDLISPEVLTRY